MCSPSPGKTEEADGESPAPAGGVSPATRSGGEAHVGPCAPVHGSSTAHGGRKRERRRAALFRPEEEDDGPRAAIREKAGGFVKN